MKSQRMRTWLRVMSILFAICITVATAQKAFAWTQEDNNYPGSPTGCGGYLSYPCLYWPEPNHVSDTLYADFLNIGSVGPTNYDFTMPVKNAMGYWNGVQGAYNPYMYNCNSGCTDAVYYYSADIGSYEWAYTDVSDTGPEQYANGQYYAIFNSASVYFNTEVSWNNNLQYNTLQADGRKVATHETGYVEGLGHRGYTAVMHQSAEPFYTPQANDINGMQTIYTGYIPA